jgi:hypothetical protein
LIVAAVVVSVVAVAIFFGPLFVRAPKATTRAEREAVAANSRELG